VDQHYELAGRGYRDEDLVKVAGRNVLQVMCEAEQTGARVRTKRPPSKATIEQLDDE
jgi:membrane dipeptidase